MTDYVCRVCSIELGIKRASKKWAAIGKCPYCNAHHVLYVVKAKGFNYVYVGGQNDD